MRNREPEINLMPSDKAPERSRRAPHAKSEARRLADLLVRFMVKNRDIRFATDLCLAEDFEAIIDPFIGRALVKACQRRRRP